MSTDTFSLKMYPVITKADFGSGYSPAPSISLNRMVVARAIVPTMQRSLAAAIATKYPDVVEREVSDF